MPKGRFSPSDPDKSDRSGPGFYVIDCADREAAIAAARDLRQANPSAMYEIRPVRLYRPGLPFPLTEAAIDA